MKILLMPVLCLMRLAICAVIKRNGSQNLGDDEAPVDSQAPLIGPDKCDTIPETILSAVLGPAFNARYMSINDPRDNRIDSAESKSSGIAKRKTSNIPSFSVEEEFNSVFSNDPAWDFEFSNMKYEDGVTNGKKADEYTSEGEITRDVRFVKNTPWQCESKVDWIDLGNDYFPRFLRSVECVKSNCWYGFYVCKPKSFTVKLLRRRSGVCIPSPSIDELLTTSKFGVAGLPNELKELWVWEERAVNFCCECAAGP